MDLINKKIDERLRAIKKKGISKKDKNGEKNLNKVLVVPFMKEVSSDIKRIVKNFVEVIHIRFQKSWIDNKKG